MIEWAKRHPWLTFWIIIFALSTVDNIVANIINAFGK